MNHILSTSKLLGYRSLFRFSELNRFRNNFLSTTNLDYIQSLYEKWVKDKNSVSQSFGAYFEQVQRGEDPETAFQKPLKPGEKLTISNSSNEVMQQLRMRLMIDRYRAQGHQFAKVDPLDLEGNKNLYGRLDPSVISVEAFGYTKDQLNSEIKLKNLREQISDDQNGPYTIQAMEDYLKKVYCDKIGFEYMHLLAKEQRDFIKKQIENQIQSLEKREPTKEQRKTTLIRLCRDQAFIDFLGNKFGNFKRFGIQGLNSATSALGQLVESCVDVGVENIFFGMAHRGRLNALHCVFAKPAQSIFRQFLEKKDEEDYDNFSGDVKYHLGYTNTKKYNGKEISLTVIPNPSHLEAVNPLVYGAVRAMQEYKQDKEKDKIMGVLIHGDAAVAGQGVVYEAIQMQDLNDYSIGGVIHIVLNNQIGFTTNPRQSRSAFYCTELAKTIDVPVLHVNSDEPDLIDKCMKIAVAYRAKFKKDFFIDIIGYRRHGHNEQDQPNFTQPIMYEKIRNQEPVFEKYSKKLIQLGIVTQKQIDQIKNGFVKGFQEDYQKVMTDKHDVVKSKDLDIHKIKPSTLWGKGTGVPREVLNQLFAKITKLPQDFNIHPTIKKIYQERIKTFTHNEHLDWATMESLSYATLLYQGYKVRLSGEDVQRGTFSHRHALVSDQKRDVEKHFFLKEVNKNNVTVTNSHLSQFGVMGFQYGYSITNPNALVIWEAQFGDFSNGAATIIDNFLVSGETKWGQQSGLVLNLPHGMDGQGPQHSSARLQRFLQMSDDNCDVDQKIPYQTQLQTGNIQVVVVSTTANYFHAMRRQIRRSYRKPLIMLNSKKLLKFKGANRPIEDILEGTEFQPVYPDELLTPPAQIKTVLICNGQFYYELKAKRQELKRHDVAIVRVEQLAPFPHEHLKKALAVYGPNTVFKWVQEEHENYGGLSFMLPRLRLLLGKPICFHGRKASGSTAVGALKLHKKEEQVLLHEIFA